jgi:hypothetical protein
MKTDMAEPQTPDQPAPAEEKLFTLSEISQRTGISMPTLQRYKKTYQDRLPSVGAGRKQRYPEHALPVFAELRSENAGRRGRPRKNAAATGSGRSSATPKRRPGRPAGARAASGRRGRPAAARAAKPARAAAKTARRPGRPRKVQPAAPARRGRPPGRPPGRPRKAAAGRRALPVRRGRVGRPPGSGRRAAGAGRRVGRPPGSGRRAAAARRTVGRSKTEGLLTLTQISKTTGISYPTLVRYVRLYSNRLPHAGKGRARRFYPEAVEVFRSLRQESGRGGRRPGKGRRAAPGTARRGRPPKAAASGVAGRLEAILVQRVRDLERFRQDVEKRFGDLVKGLQKLR